MTDKEEIVANMQQVVEQMFKDDVEENPDSLNEYFDCSACRLDTVWQIPPV